MRIEIIYTFDGMPQIKRNYPFIAAIARTKKTFISFLFADLKREERYCLIKISSYIITALESPLPNYKSHWFTQCNGKIWVDDLEKYREDEGIKSSVDPSFISQFLSENEPRNTSI